MSSKSVYIKLKERVKYFIHDLFMKIDYSNAVSELKKLEMLHDREKETKFFVPFEFRGRRHFSIIAPSQVIKEITKLYEQVTALNARNILEIGTDKGGTLYLWCQAATHDAVIVSIDLPSRRRYSPPRRKLYQRFVDNTNKKLYFLPYNSHVESTVDRVKQTFDNKELDFLFIDGDHTYEGVKQDYQMYSPLVRKGGLIAFHDIRTVRPDCGVRELWDEIIANIPNDDYWEYTENDYGPLGAGIGVIRKR